MYPIPIIEQKDRNLTMDEEEMVLEVISVTSISSGSILIGEF